MSKKNEDGSGSGGGGSNKPKVTAQTYGALDTSGVDDECWMIRIPQSLAQCWDKVAQGNVLGELVFKKGGGNVKPSITIHVAPSVMEPSQHAQDDDDDEDENEDDDDHGGKKNDDDDDETTPVVPLTYSIQAMSKKIPTYHPFIRNTNTGSVRLWGTVSRTGNLEVDKNDENYRRQLKDRLLATNVNSNRFVKPVDAPQSVITKQKQQQQTRRAIQLNNTEDVLSSGISKTFSNAVSQYGKKRNADQAAALAAAQNNYGNHNDDGNSNNKRKRQFSSDQPIRSVIFELFSQQTYWTVKDLKTAAATGGVNITKRSDGEIRDVLREIGEYHRSGDHKTMWELRKEFQQR